MLLFVFNCIVAFWRISKKTKLREWLSCYCCLGIWILIVNSCLYILRGIGIAYILCGSVSYTIISIYSHIRYFVLGSEKKFKCPKCKVRSYKYRNNLTRHMNFECGEVRHFECLYCQKRFKQKAHLDFHVLRIHPRVYLENRW